MNDEQKIAASGIISAIIVDDGYDDAPLVDELRNEGDWDNFFDDIPGHEDRIKDFYSDFEAGNRRLRQEQDFVTALWENRKKVEDLTGDLFSSYEQKMSDNAPFLDAAESILKELGIPFKKYGRDFVKEAVKADLILIDLFLGIPQGPEGMQLTIDQLRKVVEKRPKHPPSIILMSQAPNINELSKGFRDEVELHASAFRHVHKNDLIVPGRVQRQILTLAAHRKDSQALATFVNTWGDKAKEAVNKATTSLRKIDIDDLQHIRSMLLQFEGINASSYMLDVFDRVLQYEIEGHNEVRNAATNLDTPSAEPPPLTISNDRDTYKIIEQTLFVNPARRSHSTGAAWPVTFGDIIGPRIGAREKPRGFFGGKTDLVFFVASPECDLIRKGDLETILLMAGTLKEVDIAKPILNVSGKMTPILKYGAKRFQVEWNFGDLRTIKSSQAKRLFKSNGDAAIIGRLRDVSALGLRQQLLTNLGRVGEIAPMPRSFVFSAEICYLQENKEITSLTGNGEINGNILVSRKADFASLVFDSSHEDDLTQAILKIDLKNVAQGSKENIKKMQEEQGQLRKLFRSGLQLRGAPLPLNGSYDAKLLNNDESLTKKTDRKTSKKPETEKIGKVVIGGNIQEQLGNDLRKAGLIFKVRIEKAPD